MLRHWRCRQAAGRGETRWRW